MNCNDTRDPQNFSKVSILVYMCESGKSDSLVYISENNFHANTTVYRSDNHCTCTTVHVI